METIIKTVFFGVTTNNPILYKDMIFFILFSFEEQKSSFAWLVVVNHLVLSRT